MDVQTHILYVDTNPNFRRSLKTSLKAENRLFDITIVGTAEEALGKLDKHKFKCILSDYNLPKMDGVDLLKKVRTQNSDIPFILLLDDVEETVRGNAIEHNVTDYVEKDRLNPSLFANTVEAFTTQYTLEQKSGNDPIEQIESEMLQQIFERVPASLYIKNRDGQYLFMSDYDKSPDEALGKTDLEIYPEEIGKESYKGDMEVIHTGKQIINKECYNQETGEWTITSKSPWYNESGDIRGLIGVTRFITEQREQKLDLEEKNKRLEQFAAVISHDLRNPLSVADGRIQLAKQETGNENLEPALDALDRMETLIEELLQLAKGETKEKDYTNTTLPTIFEDAWSNVNTKSATYSTNGKLKFEVNKCRIKQLFENLLRNSIEHGGKDVTITIGETKNGFYYQDDGPGIDDERKDDAFDFGTTWSNDGTGFGLAIVKEIANEHNWNITLTDSESGGVRFEFQTEKTRDTTTDATKQKRSAGNNPLDAPPTLPKGEKP